MRNIFTSLVLLIAGVCGAQTQVDLAHQVKGILPPGSLGSPSFTAGTNMTITGSWPNITFNASGGANFVYLSKYATGSDATTCYNVSWPHAGCVDTTAGIQAAFVAAAALHTAVIEDPLPAGQAYFFTHVVMTSGNAGLQCTPSQYLYGSFIQIPGSNQDGFVTDTAVGTANYIDYWLMDGCRIYGDFTHTSTTGNGLVFNSRYGERTEIHRTTVSSWPNNGLFLQYGSDPFVVLNFEGSDNGFGSGRGCGANLTKTGGDPWNMVKFDGGSFDDDGTGGLCLTTGSNYSTADVFNFSNLKGEARATNPDQSSIGPLVVINNINNSPITIDGLTGVVINGQAPIGTGTATGCTGSVCTITAGTSSYNGQTPPQVGQHAFVSGNSSSTVNGVYLITSVTGGNIIGTKSTSASNTSGTGGNVFWDTQVDSAVKITGSTANMTINNVSLQGGTDSILGDAFGYKTVIHDTANSNSILLSAIPNSSASIGGSFGRGVYNYPLFCVDNACIGSGAVSSVFGRTGAVTAVGGDYTAAQVTNAAVTNGGNTYSSGVQSMTSAIGLYIPSIATTPSVNGTFDYNTTRGQYEGYGGGAIWDFPWVAVGGGTPSQCAYWISAYNLGSQACSGGFSNPMTTLGDMISGGSSGTAARLAGPTSGTTPYNLCSTPSGGVATAPAWCISGVAGRTVTGTTDTVAATDRSSTILYNSASSVAVTLTSAATLANNFSFKACNMNTGTATFTLGTGTFLASAGTTYALGQGQCVVMSSPDNTNYLASGSPGQLVAGANITLTPSATGVTIANPAPAFVAQTDGATVTWNTASASLANASLLFTTHGGSRTLNVSNMVNGGTYVLYLTQDGTGGEGLTLGTGCTWKVINGGSGAVTLSTGANAIDVLAWTYNGTICTANLGKNYN